MVSRTYPYPKTSRDDTRFSTLLFVLRGLPNASNTVREGRVGNYTRDYRTIDFLKLLMPLDL